MAAATPTIEPATEALVDGGAGTGRSGHISQNGAVGLGNQTGVVIGDTSSLSPEGQGEASPLPRAGPAAEKDASRATGSHEVANGFPSMDDPSVAAQVPLANGDHHGHHHDHDNIILNGVPNGVVSAVAPEGGGAAGAAAAAVVNALVQQRSEGPAQVASNAPTRQEVFASCDGVDVDGDTLMADKVDDKANGASGEEGVEGAAASGQEIAKQAAGEVAAGEGVVVAAVPEKGNGDLATVGQVSTAPPTPPTPPNPSGGDAMVVGVYTPSVAVNGVEERAEAVDIDPAKAAAAVAKAADALEAAKAAAEAEAATAAAAAETEAATAAEGREAKMNAVEVAKAAEADKADEKRARQACEEACLRLLGARGTITAKTHDWSVEQLLALRGGMLEVGAALCGRGMPGAKAGSAADAVNVLMRYVERRLP